MGNYGSVPTRGHSSVSKSYGGEEYIVCAWACTHLRALTRRAEAENVLKSGVLWEERRGWARDWEGVGEQAAREGREEERLPGGDRETFCPLYQHHGLILLLITLLYPPRNSLPSIHCDLLPFRQNNGFCAMC